MSKIYIDRAVLKEFKSKIKVPGGWSKTYSEASFEVITKHNYLDFIT